LKVVSTVRHVLFFLEKAEKGVKGIVGEEGKG
jgi:hypothetical protein